MKLDLILNKNSGDNLYTQIYKQLKEKIIKGEIEAHSRLPAIRKMARKNEINPATVVKAYDLLERDDFIYKKIGSGSYVSPGLLQYNKSKKNLESEDKDEDSLGLLDYGQVELAHSINFASATPSPDFFPVKDFRYAINEVLKRDKGKAFTYQKSQGYFPLRESIKNYLENIGIMSEIKNIQIVSGAQQAIDLLTKILANYGENVIVEKPTYPGILSALKSRKADIKGIPLKEDGMDLEKLEVELKKGKVRFVYIMSSFQNPTGISWSNNKKKKLIELAQKYDFLIIEDDCLSELYFKGDRPISLKSYDNSGRVVYIKSFSKIFMPGLRLAFMVLPDRFLSEILAAKHATDISSAGLTQRAFDYYLREGLWRKHLEEMRNLFKKRFNSIKVAVDKYLPTKIKKPYDPSGGLYLWLELPGYNSEDLYKKSMEKGVAFLPGSLFLADKENIPGFRLSFAAVNKEKIETGIKNLSYAIKELTEGKKEKGYTPLV